MAQSPRYIPAETSRKATWCSSTELFDLRVHRHSAETPWSYRQLDHLQRKVAERVRAGGKGAVLLSEVAPVITLGRRARAADELRMTAEALRQVGVEVLETDRGGLATWHGPGQWVLFVVDSIERLTGDRCAVRAVVEGLLEAGLRAARHLGAEVEIRGGCEAGLWGVGEASSSAELCSVPRNMKKFGSVGVRVERGVLLHGLSLNGFATPTSFVGLRPCGLERAEAGFVLGRADEGGFISLGNELVQAALDRIATRAPRGK